MMMVALRRPGKPFSFCNLESPRIRVGVRYKSYLTPTRKSAHGRLIAERLLPASVPLHPHARDLQMLAAVGLML